MNLHPTIQRAIDRIRAKKPAVDSESRKLWQGLAVANINACCNATRHARDQWDIAYLDMTFAGQPVQKVILNFCPECGRKL
jgi:hypothetical protein